jgi:8-oxo-dGTP pyrophosphatase MutT (NUDIX family)
MAEDAAIPAATLILMRERQSGPPELLMVTRTRAMAFAGGAMVFPGGRVDPGDLALAGVERSAAKVAAIRETLEESGLAVALDPVPSPELAASLQAALHRGVAFAELLSANGLSLDLEALTPFARWKPGFRQARTFDTLFFIAEAPPGEWPLRPQPGECERAEWLSAADTLARISAGDASAIFPTIRNLERLARFGTIADARADAQAHPIETITPWIEERDGEKWITIPPGLGYPVTSERLSKATRA